RGAAATRRRSCTRTRSASASSIRPRKGRHRSRWLRSSTSTEKGDSAYRRTASVSNAQREPAELELPFSDQLLKVAQPFIVRDASITADAMVGEEVVAGLVRRRTLDAVYARAIGEPVRRLIRDPGIRPDHLVAGEVSLVQAGAQEDDMAIYFHASLFLRLLKFLGIDVAQIGNVLKIKADRLSHEHIKRHLVDRVAAALGVYEGVHVSARVIDHAEEGRAASQWIVRRSGTPRLHLVVGDVGHDDGARKELVSRHVVGERDRQIDDTSRHGAVSRNFERSGSCGRISRIKRCPEQQHPAWPPVPNLHASACSRAKPIPSLSRSI